ncbi:MAG: hypothetical protein JXR37_12670 [Kiritimatiellae bacterium]|nr:hypothetical protein [Kiritimatiellia bacterium]
MKLPAFLQDRRKQIVVGVAGVLIMLAGYLVYHSTVRPLLRAWGVFVDVIEHPEELPTAPVFDVLQKEILELSLADTNLVEAAVALLEKSKIKGDPPVPSDVFSVLILTDTREQGEPSDTDSVANRSAMVTLGPVIRNVAGQLEGGWVQTVAGKDLFTNYVEVIIQNFGRGLEFFAEPEMSAKMDAIKNAAEKGDITLMANFLKKPKKIGLLLPNLKPISSRMGINIVAASFVSEVTISEDSSARVLLTCETKRDATKLYDLIEQFRERSLEVLLGVSKDETKLWRYSMRPQAARYIRDVDVRVIGSTVKVTGKAPDMAIRRLIAMTPRMADRLAKTRAGRTGRGPENIYQGMQGPSETVALIREARHVNWVSRDDLTNAVETPKP